MCNAIKGTKHTGSNIDPNICPISHGADIFFSLVIFIRNDMVNESGPTIL